MALTEFESLLGEFQWLPDRPERLPTLMEVAGYSQKENVCSNILAFFFDPKNQHGLGTLFLDALAHIGEIPNQEEIGSNVLVFREATTKAGKRIDLLIESDSHAILIENKFDSAVGNPFDEYAAHLDSLEPAGRSKHKFLLTLKRHKNVGYEFQNITHEDLVQEIRGQLGNYVAGADTRYLTLLLDFLNTLDNLQRGVVMDVEFAKFLASRFVEVEKLLKRIKAFKGELRAEVRKLEGLVNVEKYRNVEQFLWPRREPKDLDLWDTLAHHITHSSFEKKVVVDTLISPTGWKVQIWVRDGSGQDREKLRNLLGRQGIPFDEEDKYFILKERFEYAAEVGPIAKKVQNVVCNLAKSDGAA